MRSSLGQSTTEEKDTRMPDKASDLVATEAIYDTTGTDPVFRDTRPLITTPDKGIAQVRKFAIEAELPTDREWCVILHLNTKHYLVAPEVISIGSADHTFMAPREIYRSALLAGAIDIIVAHNHPSGDCAPSRDDIAVTNRLAEAGRYIGIELLDHLIIGDDCALSMARKGHIK